MLKQNSYFVGTTLFLVMLLLIIMKGLYINDTLISLIKPIRYSLLTVVAFLLAIPFVTLLKSGKFRTNSFIVMYIHLFLIGYALLLAWLNGGIKLIETELYFFLVLSVFFTVSIFYSINEYNYFLLDKIKNNLPLKFSIPTNHKLLGVFFIFSLLIIYFSGAITLDPYPIFAFDIVEIINLNYLQGTTSYFALGAIFFFFLVCASPNKFTKFCFLVIALIFLYFSMAGGARGDFAIGLFVIILIMFKFFSVRWIIITVFFLSGLVMLILSFELIDFSNFIMIRRFTGLFANENFGYRDVLLIQSFELLSNRLDCLLIGCGFNYFQIYYNYSFGQYPHNVFAELIITFGIFISLPLILIVLLGCIRGYFTKLGNTFIFYVLFYFLGISLKSGNLLTITAIPSILYFSYIGLKGSLAILDSTPQVVVKKKFDI